MSPFTITIVVPCAENEAVFLQQVVTAAIQAYRRSHVRITEVPVDRVRFDQVEKQTPHSFDNLGFPQKDGPAPFR
jgi:hypothetical protein